MADLGISANPNKALWEKGDFTRIAQTMRQSGEEFVETLAIAPGLGVLDLGCGDGTTAIPAAKRGAEVLGVDIAANLVAAGNRAREGGGSVQPPLRGRRRVEPRRRSGRQLRSAGHHFRRDVRAAPVRRRSGDGPSDQTRRPDRHGQLDSRRPDPGCADPQDQRRLHPAAARRVHRPDDVGRRSSGARALRRGGRHGPRLRASNLGLPPRGSAVRSCWRSSAIITGRP